jgi:hypothetical protein
VTVQSADNLGNSGASGCTFEIHPTVASMLNNLIRALNEGAIKNQGTYRSLQAKLQAARAANLRGQCDAAANVLGALVNELQAQRGKGVDLVVADRFIAFAQDLISRGDPSCEAGAAGREVGR